MESPGRATSRSKRKGKTSVSVQGDRRIRLGNSGKSKRELRLLTESERFELREKALSEVTIVMAQAAGPAAESLAYLAENAEDERARYSAAAKIVDWASPPKLSPMIAINNAPQFHSHLGLPQGPTVEQVTTDPRVRPALPEPRRIHAELAERSPVIEVEPAYADALRGQTRRMDAPEEQRLDLSMPLKEVSHPTSEGLREAISGPKPIVLPSEGE